MRFAGFTLDPRKGLLTRGNTTIELRPKSYAVLQYLARNPGRVLSKDELLDAVWNDVTVTEDSLTQCIRDIRLALGEAGQSLIQTMPRRGYLFAGEADTASAERFTIDKNDGGRPKLVVLPFRNLGGNPDQAYIAAGFTEDIITALARFSSFVVTGHYTVGGASIPELVPRQVADLLETAFVVDGSVRFAPDRIRISSRLTAARSEDTLWADRFDRRLDDVFSIQDEVVTSIVGALDEKLVTTTAGLARRKLAANWSAYDCLMQGRELCNQHREPEALPLLEEAVRRDPGSALAHGWLAIASTFVFIVTNKREHIEQAEASAQRALQCDDHDSTAHWALAVLNTWNKKLAECPPYFSRAMQLNPANIQIRADYANWLRFCGRTDDALQEIDLAIKQNPFAPVWFHAVRGGILFDMKDYAGALSELGRLPFQNPHSLIIQVAAYALRGDATQAAAIHSEVLKLLPGFSLAVAATLHPYAEGELRRHMLEGLKKGGVSAS